MLSCALNSAEESKPLLKETMHRLGNTGKVGPKLDHNGSGINSCSSDFSTNDDVIGDYGAIDTAEHDLIETSIFIENKVGLT